MPRKGRGADVPEEQLGLGIPGSRRRTKRSRAEPKPPKPKERWEEIAAQASDTLARRFDDRSSALRAMVFRAAKALSEGPYLDLLPLAAKHTKMESAMRAATGWIHYPTLVEKDAAPGVDPLGERNPSRRRFDFGDI